MEEISFLLCNFRVRLQYHPQFSYITTKQCHKNPESILSQCIFKMQAIKVSSETIADKVSVFISDPLLTSDLSPQHQYRKTFINSY